MDEFASASENGPAASPHGFTRRELLTALVRRPRQLATASSGIYATAATAAARATLGELAAAGSPHLLPTNGLVPQPDDPAVAFVARRHGVTVEHAAQIIYVRRLRSAVTEAAQTIFGNRLRTVTIDHQGRLVITVTALRPTDTHHVRRLAKRFGIEDWVRAERAAAAS